MVLPGLPMVNITTLKDWEVSKRTNQSNLQKTNKKTNPKQNKKQQNPKHYLTISIKLKTKRTMQEYKTAVYKCVFHKDMDLQIWNYFMCILGLSKK